MNIELSADGNVAYDIGLVRTCLYIIVVRVFVRQRLVISFYYVIALRCTIISMLLMYIAY